MNEISKMELKAIWEYAEVLELTEKGSPLYNEVKELLINHIKSEVESKKHRDSYTPREQFNL